MATRDSVRSLRRGHIGALAALCAAMLVVSSVGASATAELGWAIGLEAAAGSSGAVVGMAVDGSGNAYVAGAFEGTIDADPGAGVTPLTSAGHQDALVAKYNASGALVWAHRIGGTNFDGAWAIDLDAAGDLVVVGGFTGTVDFDPSLGGSSQLTSQGTPPDDLDGYVLKLTAAGGFVWVRQIASSTDASAHGVVTDGSNNIYATGAFQGTTDFDPGPGIFNVTSAGSDDGFVLKLDSSGVFGWAGGFGGTEGDRGWGIDLAPGGDAYVAAHFQGTADFDPGPGTANLTALGSADAVLLRLNASGGYAAAHQFGGLDADMATDVVLGGAGNPYVAGTFSAIADMNPGAGAFDLTTSGSQDVFVVSLTPAGGFGWAVGLGGAALDYVHDVALDAAGNLLLAGAHTGDFDADPGAGVATLAGHGLQDAFFAQLTPAGSLGWAAGIGGANQDGAYAVGQGTGNSFYLGGFFTGLVDFDPSQTVTTLNSGGGTAPFLTALQPAPEIEITTPADGEAYGFGEEVLADFACTDTSGAGIASCVGDVSDGQPIDTSTVGNHLFSVTGTDNLGGTTTLVHTYTVDPPVCAGLDATIVGTEKADVIVGTAGNDVIWSGFGNDLVDGLDGNDTICLGPGNDVAVGDGGNDTIIGGGGNDEIRGGAGADVLRGGFGADIVKGGGGDDLLQGKGGSDYLYGGRGNDELRGGSGADRLLGKAGGDVLLGQKGPDHLWGGAGHDTGHGGPGIDKCVSVETSTSC